MTGPRVPGLLVAAGQRLAQDVRQVPAPAARATAPAPALQRPPPAGLPGLPGAAASGPAAPGLGPRPAGAPAVLLRRLFTEAGDTPSAAVRALQVQVRGALDAMAPPRGGPPLAAAQWHAACARLQDAQGDFAHAMRDGDPDRPPADHLALHDLRGMLRAVNDCLPAFEHLALTGRPLRPADLLDHLSLEHADLVPIAGHPNAHPDAVAMLNLSGVSAPVQSEARGLHWSARLFVLVNAQSRLHEPALDRVMAGMRAAHDHGIDLLPSLDAGNAVRRGMSVDAAVLRLMAGRFEGAARTGEVVAQRGMFTGSRAEGNTSAAYPGNVQMRVTTADGSALKDASAFNHVPEQQEAKARALAFVVQEARLLPPGQPLPPSFAIDAQASASSGRHQRDFADGPVLLLSLQEVPRPH